MTIENVSVAGPAGQPPVRVRVYRPVKLRRPAPALYWIHGGGFVQGSPEQDDRTCIAFSRELGIVVASVDYRLAPRHPFPAPLDDVYAGLQWLAGNAGSLGVDPRAIAVGGASAGGGLAAGLALLARDRGVVSLAFQLLVYPMLDDRTVLRTGVDTTYLRGWIPQNNRFGWTAYLGREPGGPGVSEYAAPARCEDLSGLPPAWIGVGTNDLFHDEDLDYARRLTGAGVGCEVTVVDGAFHGFDAIFSKTGVSRAFLQAQIDALRTAS
jgi:acetyl esterase/lipase